MERWSFSPSPRQLGLQVVNEPNRGLPDEREGILITRHGKPVGVLIGFGSEEDWFEEGWLGELAEGEEWSQSQCPQRRLFCPGQWPTGRISASVAESLMKSWYFGATHSRLRPVIKAAKTIKENWDGVLRWFTSGVTNELLEGMNSLIQTAKGRAGGFRTTRYLVTMIYLLLGKLDLRTNTLLSLKYDHPEWGCAAECPKFQHARILT